MYYHSVKNPNVKHDLRDEMTLYRIKATTRLLFAAVKAVLNPNVLSFEFDKTNNSKP
jgi:hypothetical protein